MLLVWFQGQLFWFCLLVYFCKNCTDLVYIIERGENTQREDTYVFPIFFLSFVFVVFTMWDGLVEHCLLLERKTEKLVRQNWQSYLCWIPDFSFSSVITAVCCFLKWSSLDKQIRTQFHKFSWLSAHGGEVLVVRAVFRN